MTEPRLITCHDSSPRLRDFRIEWRHSLRRDLEGNLEPDQTITCSYCGSVEMETVLKALQTNGTHYSGSDWKYGWPHKFYLEIPCEPYRTAISSRSEKKSGNWIQTYEYGMRDHNHHKFYSAHMVDATEEQLVEWNQIAEPLLGIGFVKKDGQLNYRSPRKGFQTWGVVGAAPEEFHAPVS